MATQNNAVAGSGNPYIDSLVWGDGWTRSPITYSLNSSYASKFGVVYY